MAILKHLLNTQDITSILSLSAIALMVYYLITFYKHIKKLPPGPWGYPILGQIKSINMEFHLFLLEQMKKFGKVISLKMGNSTLVVLSDYKLIKKAFGSKDFTARPKTGLSDFLGGYGKGHWPVHANVLERFFRNFATQLSRIFTSFQYVMTNVTKIWYFAGVINAEGDLWKSQRRYLLHQKLGMRHWGQGMSQIETRIEHEAALLLDTMYREHHSVAFNPANLVNCAVSNVICSMIMSTRFDSHDPAFQRFMSNFDEGFRLFGMTGSLMWFPWMKILPGIRNSMEKLKSNHQEMLSFVQNIIHAHKLNLDPSNPRDLIDSYLLMIEKIQNDYSNNNEQEETKNIFHGVDPEKQLEQIILDLFSAGVETLKTTVLWSIVYMMYFPEVRKKVQAELDAVVGPTRLPKVKDMPQLTYTKATMYEIMRRSSVVPLGTTHSTER